MQKYWFLKPVYIFIFLMTALATSLFLYIYWYIEISSVLETVMESVNLDPEQVLSSQPWMVIMVVSLLAAMSLTGMFMSFVYIQNAVKLYHMQQNFINNFTHELKTPVTSLKLYIETFLKYELPRDDQLKYLNYMVKDVTRLSENIGNILDLAGIESRNYNIHFEKTDLVHHIKDFYVKNEYLFEKCDIRIHEETGKSFICPLDQSLFDMLMMNLTTNAIKYNNSDIPVIDITFQNLIYKYVILFADNGIGIAKSETKNIFNKFYQVGKSDDMSAKGSGLGLHFVINIAKIHKWKINAVSKGLKNGTVFKITIPKAQTLLPNK